MYPQDCSRNHRLSKKMSALMPPKSHNSAFSGLKNHIISFFYGVLVR